MPYIWHIVVTVVIRTERFLEVIVSHEMMSLQSKCMELIMSYSSLGAHVWHVLTRDHAVLPATDTFIHNWNEPYLPLLPAAERRRTLAGTHFPSPTVA